MRRRERHGTIRLVAAPADKDGAEQFQAAEVVVIACNGIGTPRLLLNSASGRFPDGLANSSGLVGKNLMFHPYALLYGYVDEQTDSNRAPPTCLWSKQFYETDLSRGFVRGYAFQFGRGVGPVVEAVMSESKGILPWGAEHHGVFRRLNGHRLSLAAICEDLPEERNRVTLDPVLKDSHGIPAPRVDYTIGENSAKMLEHAGQPNDTGLVVHVFDAAAGLHEFVGTHRRIADEDHFPVGTVGAQ